jgi:hypothetical protein
MRFSFSFSFCLAQSEVQTFFAVSYINQYECIFLLSHYGDKKQQEYLLLW